MIRRAPLAALLFTLPGDVLCAESPDSTPSVGVATMLPNGTILVGIRAPEPGGQLQAVLMVEPGDTNYQQIIDHVGGLKPGETKSIPPWPEQRPAPEPENKPAELQNRG